MHRVLAHLGTYTGGIAQDTDIIVVTTKVDRPPQYTAGIRHDWPSGAEQEGALRALFGGIGRATLRAEDRHSTSHFRELRLTWHDGKVLVVRLDSGLTFLKSRGSQAWRFGDPPQIQAAALQKLNLDVMQEGLEVPLYVRGWA